MHPFLVPDPRPAMRRLLLAATLPSLVLGAGLTACAKPDAVDAVRSDSAGIEIVQNSGTDRALDWPVTAVDTVIDGSVDSMIQGDARSLSLGADDRGRLAFADGGFNDRRVLREGDDGTLRQVGRHGGGPGEYELVGTVGVSPAGELLVLDYSKHAFVRFGADDKPLPSVPWTAFGPGWPQTGGYAAGGVVAVLGETTESTSVKRMKLVTATDTVLLAEVHEPPMKMVMFESCKVGFGGQPLFYPDTRWAGNADAIALATTDRYEIQLWRHGRLVRTIRRDLAPRPATAALAAGELGEGHKISFNGRPPCLIPAREIIEKQGVAATIPPIRRLALAGDGTLWVDRFTVKGETPIRDVFDSTGAYLGTLTGEIAWPQAWLPNGRFVAVSANADSLPVVVRYAVGGPVRNE